MSNAMSQMESNSMNKQLPITIFWRSVTTAQMSPSASEYSRAIDDYRYHDGNLQPLGTTALLFSSSIPDISSSWTNSSLGEFYLHPSESPLRFCPVATSSWTIVCSLSSLQFVPFQSKTMRCIFFFLVRFVSAFFFYFFSFWEMLFTRGISLFCMFTIGFVCSPIVLKHGHLCVSSFFSCSRPYLAEVAWAINSASILNRFFRYGRTVLWQFMEYLNMSNDPPKYASEMKLSDREGQTSGGGLRLQQVDFRIAESLAVFDRFISGLGFCIHRYRKTNSRGRN